MVSQQIVGLAYRRAVYEGPDVVFGIAVDRFFGLAPGKLW